jgi:YD repeat-containing protein
MVEAGTGPEGTDDVSERDEISYTGADGNPADELTATRATVRSGGVVRAVLDYVDDDGNPAAQSAATRVSTTRYDAAGNMTQVAVSSVSR